MKIVYCGCGEFGLNSLDAIKSSAHELVAIITHPAAPAGRGRKTRPTAVAVWTEQNSVPCFEIADSNSPEGVELLKRFSPDLVVVIAFGQKISEEFIAIPSKGAINVHASLLPKYRGAAPINWAIINGETETGVSIITLSQKMDAGEILAKSKIPIAVSDTAADIHDKLAVLAGPVLIDTIDSIEAGTIIYEKQDSSLATAAPKLKKSDGCIDFSADAVDIHDKIRGLWSWPGATAVFLALGKKPCEVIIAKSAVSDSAGTGEIGTLDGDLNVICGQGRLKILQIKPKGGKMMDFKAFLNGRGSESGGAGDCFVVDSSHGATRP